MTDFADSYSGPLPARAAGRPRPPGVVVAAAVVTWVAASGTALLTLFLAVSFVWLVGPVFGTFDSGPINPGWMLAEGVGVVLALSAAADVAAFFVLRGHRWARWVLIGLCVSAAAAGVMLAYYVGTLLVTAAAVAVAVLLLVPGARTWFGAPRERNQTSAN